MAKSEVSRDIRKVLEDLAIEVVKERRSKHLVLTLRNRFAVTGVYVMPISASCHRAMKNQLSLLRRFAEQTEATHVR
ncbi:MAG: hypothetical protein LPK02_07150 [Rhodobacterales bacterium]|nr:hypothetical protein [Rhodobacterales bacterium]